MGFGDRAASCREYTLSRDDPVLEDKTICHLNAHGIEILIPSTSGDSTNFWVVISRGPNHHVGHLRHNDPDSSPASFEEADYGSIEETHAEQPTTQSRSQCNQSEDHIPIHAREWIDITPNGYSHEYHTETRISKFVIRLVRHMVFQDGESDRAFHWKYISSKLRHAFLHDGGNKFLQ